MNAVYVRCKAADRACCEESVSAGGVDFCCALAEQCVAGATDGSTCADHVVDDRDDFALDIEVLRLVLDGVCVDSGFLEIAELDRKSVV